MAKGSKRVGSEPVTYECRYHCPRCDKEREFEITRHPLGGGIVPLIHRCPACRRMCFAPLMEVEEQEEPA